MFFYYIIIGKCELNNLQIYTNPGTYYIKALVENYNDEIEFNFENIDVEILKCKQNYITAYDKNNIMYCEKAICKPNCPVGISASCVPNTNSTLNKDIKYSECKCDDGWMGDDCDIKIFIDFR